MILEMESVSCQINSYGHATFFSLSSSIHPLGSKIGRNRQSSTCNHHLLALDILTLLLSLSGTLVNASSDLSGVSEPVR